MQPINNIDAVRLYLGFDSNPSGAESITISPVSGEIFDQGNNPLPWTQHWLSSKGQQNAPQETEIESYVIGGIKQDIEDDTFKGFKL